MPLQHKHSRTNGSVPNLIPGQIGVNWLDEDFWLRTAGKKVAVDIQKWQTYAAPTDNGFDGAPLQKTDDGVAWVPELAPSSEVDGVVMVDGAAPGSVYGIPGVIVTGVSGSVMTQNQQAIVEYFYVASDSILIDKAAVNVISGGGSTGRIVIADMNDTVQTLASFNGGVTPGMVNTASVFISLQRGWYKVIFWSNIGAELAQITGYAFEQGFELDDNGQKQFRDHQYATVDWSSSVFLSGIGWFDSFSYTPGVRRLIALHWSN